MLWIKISHLKNGLENWRTQLLKMLDHIQELEDTSFGIECIDTIALRRRRDALIECGKRIGERLRDLIDEYDNFIRECDHIMAGMSLAMQLVNIFPNLCLPCLSFSIFFYRSLTFVATGSE